MKHTFLKYIFLYLIPNVFIQYLAKDLCIFSFIYRVVEEYLREVYTIEVYPIGKGCDRGIRITPSSRRDSHWDYLHSVVGSGDQKSIG
jgi:hypothetical protein